MRANLLTSLGSPARAYTRLTSQLAQAGWICQGTVVQRRLRRKVKGKWVLKGPYYLWTGKRRGKTVCHALSKTQYELAKQAIAANRRVLQTLSKLQTHTLERILTKLPGVQKRK